MGLIPKYEDFINLLKKKSYGINIPMEQHHITPRFEFTDSDNPLININDNLILISVGDHTLAHYVRYKNFKKKGDKISYLMRRGQTNLAAIIKKQLIVETHKLNKTLFWSPEWQSAQGKKGGLKGGSANSRQQFLARQKVGLEYGRQVGISNQSSSLKLFLEKITIWEYGETNFLVEVGPQKSFADVVLFINNCAEQENKFRRSNQVDIITDNSTQIRLIKSDASFSKVRTGERKSLYGWSYLGEAMEIRSEADDG